jgi:bacterioferritin-associated ferredoxin
MSCCKNKVEGCKKNKEQQADYLVCTCMGVMYSDISTAIEQGADNFEKLSEQLGVGTGCSSCVAEVETILKSQKQSNCCKR